MQEVIIQYVIYCESASWVWVQQTTQQPGYYIVLLLIRDECGQANVTTWYSMPAIKVSSLQAIYANLAPSCCAHMHTVACPEAVNKLNEQERPENHPMQAAQRHIVHESTLLRITFAQEIMI